MSEIKKAQNQSKFKAAFQKGKKKKKELSNLIYTSKPYKCLQVLIILLSYKITLCTTLRYWN